MSNPVDELEWEGDQIANGRYHIKELLGSSMALVYRADQELILQKEPLVREVVIKTPRPRLLDDSTGLTERFQREIRALIHLTQPNIVRILDAGVHAIHHNERTQAWPFAVMEYLAGGNLHRNCCIDDRTSSCLPQELDRLADWLNPLAHALDFIHAQGYVHRDVKPENILFDGGGHVYLSDFGIVAALSAQDHSAFSSWKTKAGFVLGTPEYMAPELAKGEGLDGRVDQYSLGVVVHQLLCGRLPFEAPTPVALMVKHAHEAPPRLSDLQPSIPAHVSNIVLQALSKNPADRFLDCRSFVEALLTKRESVKPVGPDPIDPQPVIESEVQDTIVQDLGKGLLILQQKVLDSSKWIRDTTQTVFARVAEIWRTALVKAPQEPNATSESRPQSSKRQETPHVAGQAAPRRTREESGSPKPVAQSDSEARAATKKQLWIWSKVALFGMACVVVLVAWESLLKMMMADPKPELARAPFDSQAARRFQGQWAEHLGVPTRFTNSMDMEFVLIPPGEFLMGCDKVDTLARLNGVDAGSFADESVQHRVEISKPFYLQTTEVTRRQWTIVTDTPPRAGKPDVKEGDAHPKTFVSWEGAVEFCQRLSELEDREYRLPTEAEWEYACRAGSGTLYSFGNESTRASEYAWIMENTDRDDQGAHAVELKVPNAWKLYDMHGNVSEFCSDWYKKDYYKSGQAIDPQGPPNGSFRVHRGGCWKSTIPSHWRSIRSADRNKCLPSSSDNWVGFRVAVRSNDL